MANIERLTQLRRVVEAAPEHLLDMGSFKLTKDCGTAYCAAGWAAIDPWFVKQGLDLFAEVDGGDPFYHLADFFNLDTEDANNLFGADLARNDNVSKEEVLANIDRLIAGQHTEPYPGVEEDYDDEATVEGFDDED